MVAAMPDQALDPDSSAASSAPNDRVAPIPMPPRICPVMSTRTTRFCTAVCHFGSFGNFVDWAGGGSLFIVWCV